MAQLDETPITRVEMKIDRMTLGETAEVKFLKTKATGNGYDVVLTLTQEDDWSITAVKNLYINVDFLRFLVLDFEGFEDLLDETEAVFFEGIIYKLHRVQRPIGLARVWEFKLEPVTNFPVTI